METIRISYFHKKLQAEAQFDGITGFTG